MPVVRTGGIVVQQVVDAGELDFNGPRHRIGQNFRVGAGIVGFDLHNGRVISGNWATGRACKATKPITTMTIDNTEAKIGRSIKKCEITRRAPAASEEQSERSRHRRREPAQVSPAPGRDFMQALYNDAIADMDPFFDNPLVPLPTRRHNLASQLCRPCPRRIRWSPCALLHRALRHQDRAGLGVPLNRTRTNCPGNNTRSGLGNTPRLSRSRIRFQSHIEQVQHALMLVRRPIDKGEHAAQLVDTGMLNTFGIGIAPAFQQKLSGALTITYMGST